MPRIFISYHRQQDVSPRLKDALVHALIGRDEVMERLLAETRTLRHSHLCVTGLGGVGKTRLVAELVERSRLPRVLWITLDKDLTLTLFWDWLGKGLDDVPTPDDIARVCRSFLAVGDMASGR